MVEEYSQIGVSDTLDDLGKACEEPFVAHSLVVERRQHEHAAATGTHRVPGELDAVGEGAAAGADHQALRGYAGFDDFFDKGPSLGDRERIRLAGGPEQGETVTALGEKPTRVGDEPSRIDAQIRTQRDENRRPDAAGGKRVDGAGRRCLHSGIGVHGGRILGEMRMSRQ